MSIIPMEVSYRHKETSMPADPDVVIISPDATGKQHCGNEVERQLSVSHHDQCGETVEINDNSVSNKHMMKVFPVHKLETQTNTAVEKTNFHQTNSNQASNKKDASSSHDLDSVNEHTGSLYKNAELDKTVIGSDSQCGNDNRQNRSMEGRMDIAVNANTADHIAGHNPVTCDNLQSGKDQSHQEPYDTRQQINQVLLKYKTILPSVPVSASQNEAVFTSTNRKRKVPPYLQRPFKRRLHEEAITRLSDTLDNSRTLTMVSSPQTQSTIANVYNIQNPMYMSTGNALPSQCNLTNTVPLPAASKPAILQFPMMTSMISAGQDAISSVNSTAAVSMTTCSNSLVNTAMVLPINKFQYMHPRNVIAPVQTLGTTVSVPNQSSGNLSPSTNAQMIKVVKVVGNQIIPEVPTGIQSQSMPRHAIVTTCTYTSPNIVNTPTTAANLMTTSASTSYNIIMSGSKTTEGLNNSTNAKMMTYQSPVTPITVDHAHHMASTIIDSSIVKTLSTNTSMAITVTDSNTVSVSNKCKDMVICREDNNVSDKPSAVNVLTCASTKTATISQPSMNPLSCRETSLPNTVTCAVEESLKAESFIDKSSPDLCKLDSFDPPSCANSNQTSIPNSNLSPSLPRLKFAEQGAKQVQQRLRKLLALQKQPESWKEDVDSLKGIDSTLSVTSSDSACSVSTSTVKPQMNNSVSNDVIHSPMNNDVSSSWIHPSDNKNDSVSAIHLAMKDGVTTVHPTIGNVQLRFRKFPVQRIHVKSVIQKNEVDAQKGACAALPMTASDSACSVVTGKVDPPMSNSVSSSAIHQPMKDGVTTGAVHPIMDNVQQRCRKLLAERIHVRSQMQKNEVDVRKGSCAALPVTSSDYVCSFSTSIVDSPISNSFSSSAIHPPMKKVKTALPVTSSDSACSVVTGTVDPPMSNSVSSSAIHQPMNIVKTTTVVSTMTPIMTTHSLRKSTASDVQLSPNTTMEKAKTTNKVMPKISPKTSSHLGNTGMRCIDPMVSGQTIQNVVTGMKTTVNPMTFQGANGPFQVIQINPTLNVFSQAIPSGITNQLIQTSSAGNPAPVLVPLSQVIAAMTGKVSQCDNCVLNQPVNTTVQTPHLGNICTPSLQIPVGYANVNMNAIIQPIVVSNTAPTVLNTGIPSSSITRLAHTSNTAVQLSVTDSVIYTHSSNIAVQSTTMNTGSYIVLNTGMQPNTTPSSTHSNSLITPIQPNTTPNSTHSNSLIIPMQPNTTPTSIHSNLLITPMQPNTKPSSTHSNSLITPMHPYTTPNSTHSNSLIIPMQPNTTPSSTHSNLLITPMQPNTTPSSIHSNSLITPMQPNTTPSSIHSNS
ncbi:uncharacterized protein [Ptychodera flava]|uniref:uncharacterized protein n=1 Tax=Ptychodera flava TaxID=63121 RepID=UPI003969F2ED